jgi:hypothetical protein
VKSVDGNNLTLSTAQDVTEVRLSDSTQIEKQAEGSLADLQPGTRIIVIGEEDSDGVIDAVRVTILGANVGPFEMPAPQESAP